MEIDDRLLCMLAQGFTFPEMLLYHGRGKWYIRSRLQRLYRDFAIPTSDSRDYGWSRYDLKKAVGEKYPWALTTEIELGDVEVDPEVESLLLEGFTQEVMLGILGISKVSLRARVAAVYRKYGVKQRPGGLCRGELIEKADKCRAYAEGGEIQETQDSIGDKRP